MFFALFQIPMTMLKVAYRKPVHLVDDLLVHWYGEEEVLQYNVTGATRDPAKAKKKLPMGQRKAIFSMCKKTVFTRGL